MYIEAGDVVMVHSKKPIGRLIQFGMNLIRWTSIKSILRILQGKEPIYKFIYNHGGMGRFSNTIQEAIAKGVKTRNESLAYPHMKLASSLEDARLNSKKYIIAVYRYNWTQRQLIAHENLSNSIENIKYQFDNFLLYLIYILSFRIIWLGKQNIKATNNIYCTEANSYKMFYMTNPLLSTNKIDKDIHYRLRKYWIGHPLKQQLICEDYFIPTYYYL